MDKEGINLNFSHDEKTRRVELQAILTRANPKADGSMTLGFVTQELSPDAKLILMENLRKYGVLLFQEGDQSFNEETIPEYDPKLFDESKSPSVRLRGVLYRIWEKKGKKGDFETYYRAKMEAVIEWAKGKLNENAA